MTLVPRGWAHVEDSLACGSVSITADAIRLNACWFLPDVSPELGALVSRLMQLPAWRRRTFVIGLKDEATMRLDPNDTAHGRAALTLVADAIAEPDLESALLVLRRAEGNASRGLPWSAQAAQEAADRRADVLARGGTVTFHPVKVYPASQYEVHRDDADSAARIVEAYSPASAVRIFALGDTAGWLGDMPDAASDQPTVGPYRYDELLWARQISPVIEADPGQAYRVVTSTAYRCVVTSTAYRCVAGQDSGKLTALRNVEAEDAWHEIEARAQAGAEHDAEQVEAQYLSRK